MKPTADPDSPDALPPLTITNEGMIWLGAALLLAGVGWWKSVNLVLLLAYLMAALILLNGLLARANARRVTATREPLPPVHAGESAVVGLVAANAGRRPATATVTDRGGGEPVSWLVHRLPPGSAAPCPTRRTFPARGRFPAAPVRVSSGFPFGLLRYDHPGGSGADLIVLPAAGVADADGLRRWVLLQAGGDGRARRVLRRVTSEQADVRGVRPYRHGDPIRSVHWRSSARRGELMVREYDAAPSPDLILVVEPWLPADPTPADDEFLEAALSLAVTVAETWGREGGGRVTVAVAGDPASVRLAVATDVGIREALAPLADLSGAEAFAPLGPGAFGRPLARAARLVVSSRPASPHAAALARATGRPFLAVSPAERLPWYQPPPRSQEAGARRP